jgi:hypothetical protein
MSTRYRTLLPYVPYLLLALAVMAPLLTPGFVLTMDMVFTPALHMPNHVDNTWLFYSALHILNVVIPADVLEKTVLLCAFLLSGIGAHRLLAALRSERHWNMAICAGSVFYQINPFVYDRLMAGQYGVLLGYALLPWIALSLWRFAKEPSRQRALVLALLVSATSIVSVHSLGFVAVLVTVAAIACARDRPKLKKFAAYGALGLGLFLLASSYWLVPAITGQGRIADSLSTFTNAGRTAFTTVDVNGLTSLGSVLGLQGFWQETRGLYLLPSEGIGAWEWIQFAVIALVGVGVWRSWKRQRGLAMVAIGVAVMSIVLALGVGGDWLAAHVPFFAGFREPQKFVALLCLTHAYFVTWAAAWLLERLRGRWMQAAAVGLALLPLIYTPTMLWGAYGQLRPVAYPADWSVANRTLNAQIGAGKVLILPWHLYMSFGFTNRIIASPASSFYDRAVMASDDPELAGVASQTHDRTREATTRLLAVDDRAGLSSKLQALGVGYILVNKELDYQDYDYLSDMPGAKLLQDSQTLRLYQLTNDTMEQHETH